MSQSGYGYNMPRGFHTAPDLQNPPHTSFVPQYSKESAEVAARSAQVPYQYPRNIIPGLGLGFATSAPAQHNSSAAQQADRWESSSQSLQAAGPPGAVNSRPPMNINVGHGTAEDGSEEGEISEGDEDLYDPREAGRLAAASDIQVEPQSNADGAFDIAMMDRQDAPPAFANPSAGVARAELNWSTNQSGLVRAARERSGSYSPYLSPQEMSNVDLKRVTVEQASHEDSSNPGKRRMPSSNDLVESPRQLTANNDTTATSPVNAIGTAKQQARDAILGLWPLNVRHQNFLEEGIDSAILGGLLKDLGLEVQENIQLSSDTASKDATTLQALASPTCEGSNASRIVAIPSRPGHAETAKSVDKSEERKDRIARLLAAKGSKQQPTPATASVTIPASPPPVAPPRPSQALPKAQSEKSKLLQQKMDALRKSRESLARIQSQQQASVSSMEDEAEAEQPSISDVAPADFDAGEERPSILESSTQEPGSGKPSPSIPGLFLSSTPQLSHQTESSQQRRPAPGSSDPLAKPVHRPFGQQTESRPFLINVSEDEDDAEMDIDSPDRTSSPADHPESTSQRAAAVLREPLYTVNNTMPRHAITPASAATPPRSSGNNSGGEDLANMNKKIEAMKRRIAEAEARKKIKLLRQASPATSHLDDSSRGASVEAASTPRGVAAPSSSGRSHTPVNNNNNANNGGIGSAPATMPQERAGRSRVYGSKRRSLSTAASERLPLIEARRREQLLKLQSLQMQIAKVEQEIAEGMREEQNLKNLVSDDSDLEESQATPPTAPFGAVSSIEGSGVSYANTPGKAPVVNIAPKSLEPTGSERENGTSERAEPQAEPATGHDAETLDQSSILVANPEHGDVAMKEADDCAGDSEEGSDDYEPPDANPSQESPSPTLQFPPAYEKHALPQLPESAAKDVSIPAATAQRAPADQAQSVSEFGREEKGDTPMRPRQGHEPPESALGLSQGSISESTQLQFVPYETPLQYFRAFRFHPEFGKSVTGGLRSLTYSNKIDVQREVCPEELAGQACPRGSQCGYQHFDNMKAPDEQILLQLGAAGNYPAEQKQEYIAGLRQLLTDFRNRKVKDFDTISRGIVDYRAQFLKDRSKILPLGGVTI